MDSRYIQFTNAKNLNGLLDKLRPLLTISPEEYLKNFFSIDTCDKDGLDNWGRILCINRIVQIKISTAGVFGFDEDNYPIPENGYPQNFDNGNFYNPEQGDAYVPYELSDYEYRVVLKFRYASLTSNLSVKSINKIMNDLIKGMNPKYKCAVVQSGIMELTYKFNFALSEWQNAIFIDRNILPVPAGVTAILEENVLL